MIKIKGNISIVLMLSALLLQPMIGSCDKEPAAADSVPFVRLLTDQFITSDIYKGPIHFAALLPDNYNNTTETYPVVYLLHGFGDDERAWYSGGNIKYYTDKFADEISPAIYIMPEAFNTYYVNGYNGRNQYMKMFTTEFVPAIDSIFRTKKESSQRAVMGYSMGGYGALIIPALNPDMFSVSVPLSMSFRTDSQYVTESQGAFDVQWGPIFGGTGTTGTARLTDYFIAHSPFHFFNEETAPDFQNLKLFIDCGDDEESLSKTNDSLHCLLRDLGIPHQYRVRNGAHTWNYWHGALGEALLFISDAFNGISYPADPEPVEEGTQVSVTDYKKVSAGSDNIVLNVLTPDDYSTGSLTYHVIYIIHDCATEDREAKAVRLFSLLKNAMLAGTLEESIIVEMPGEIADDSFINNAVAGIDAGYRTVKESSGRILLLNGSGDKTMLLPGAETSGLFNSFFMFNARLGEATPEVHPSLFYYLDITDTGAAYAGYHNLLFDIREKGAGYQYRVRHGSDTYQSFLNGVSEAFYYLNKQLRM